MTANPTSAQSVELLVLDVDGVLTNGTIALDDDGRELKQFNVRDGAGLRIWMRLGGKVAIITGRSGQALRHRAEELGIRDVRQGVKDKGAELEALLDHLELEPAQAAAMGDDLPDLAMLRRVGFPIAVSDAAAEVRDAASYVTTLGGGQGAVREAIEHLIRARGAWDEVMSWYDR